MLFGKRKIKREVEELKEFQGENVWRFERISEQLKRLEKNYASIKKQIRESQTARKELATRITKLELKGKNLTKKRR